MIFVDTSVWIAAFRGVKSIAESLSALLDDDVVALVAPVRVELLAGASKRDQEKLARVLTALPIFVPSADTWERVETWAKTGRAHGETFGVADMIIAATCTEAGGQLWSLDDDFRRMQQLKWVKLYTPPPRKRR
ncbi:MAG TPA: PIN domain-containing protein [Polyangiaceae bacterium]|nr:PIN domain-containing protein [Polyangiaceae bacterium]